jgi:hypothetical protein
MTNCNDSSSHTIPLQEEESDDISCQTGVTTLLATNVHKRVTVRLSILVVTECALKQNLLTRLFMPLPVVVISYRKDVWSTSGWTL